MATNYEITSLYMQLYASIRGHAFRRQFDCQTQLALMGNDIKFCCSIHPIKRPQLALQAIVQNN